LIASGNVLAWGLLAGVSFVVGLFVGAVGIGGILLIPVLAVLGPLTIHAASATALFTFFFTGVVGALLFARRGSIDWRACLPVCAGALVLSYIGAVVNAGTHDVLLSKIIGLVILFAGACVLRPPKQLIASEETYGRWWLLFAIGALAGFG